MISLFRSPAPHVALTFSPCCLVISLSVSQSNLFPTKRSSASSEAYCGILKEAAFQRWALSHADRKCKSIQHFSFICSFTPQIFEHLLYPRQDWLLWCTDGSHRAHVFRKQRGNRYYEPQCS